jgi:hypothetical protein
MSTICSQWRIGPPLRVRRPRCQEQRSNQTNVSAHCSPSFRAIAQRISRWRDVPVYCTELFAWLVSNPRCNRERLAIACSTARALPTARRSACVEESSVRSRLYCNCGDDARDLPNPVALPLLSPLPGTAQRHRLGIAFSSVTYRAQRQTRPSVKEQFAFDYCETATAPNHATNVIFNAVWITTGNGHPNVVALPDLLPGPETRWWWWGIVVSGACGDGVNHRYRNSG